MLNDLLDIALLVGMLIPALGAIFYAFYRVIGG